MGHGSRSTVCGMQTRLQSHKGQLQLTRRATSRTHLIEVGVAGLRDVAGRYAQAKIHFTRCLAAPLIITGTLNTRGLWFIH